MSLGLTCECMSTHTCSNTQSVHPLTLCMLQGTPHVASFLSLLAPLAQWHEESVRPFTVSINSRATQRLRNVDEAQSLPLGFKL